MLRVQELRFGIPDVLVSVVVQASILLGSVHGPCMVMLYTTYPKNLILTMQATMLNTSLEFLDLFAEPRNGEFGSATAGSPCGE